MKNRNSRVTCLILILGIMTSCHGCSKGETRTKRETEKLSKYLEVAESVMDSLLSLDYKQLKKDGFSEKKVETVETFEKEFGGIKETIEKATYEIDEDTFEKGDAFASCEAIIRLPDHSKASKEAKEDLKKYLDLISSQSKKNYQKITVEIRFQISEDDINVSNTDELLVNVIGPVYKSALSVAVGASLDEVTTPAQIPTPTQTPTQTPTPSPVNDSQTGPFISLLIGDIKKVDLNEGVFARAVKKTDSSITDIQPAIEVDDQGTQMTRLLNVQSGNIMYSYSEYLSEVAAKENFNALSGIAKSTSQYYVDNTDWGCSAAQFSSVTMLVYFSGKVVILCSSKDSEFEDVFTIAKFAENLAGAT